MRQLYKFLIVILFFSVVLGTVSAEPNIEPIDPPEDWSVSNSSESVQMVNLTTVDGEPYTEQMVEDNENIFSHQYPTGDTDNREDMIWIEEGYWYSSFKPSHPEGEEILFELWEHDDDRSGIISNETMSFDIGDLNVEMVEKPEEDIRPNDEISIEVNVTDTDGNFVDDTEVDIYLYNSTYTSERYDTRCDEGCEVYERDDTVEDLEFGESYVLYVVAGDTDDQKASTSTIISTVPSLQAEISNINAQKGCSVDDDGMLHCERNGETEFEVNITASEAEEVIGEIQAWDRTSEEWDMLTNSSFEEEDQVFSGKAEMPDEINTTKYNSTLRANFEVSNENLTTNLYENISYRDFKVRDLSSGSTVNPPSYEVKFEALKPFSNSPIEQDRLTGTVEIINETGGVFDSFNVSDMSYDSGDFTNEVDFGFDNEGDYYREIYVENPFGDSEINDRESNGFSIADVNNTFDISTDEITLFVERQDNYTESFNLTDLGAGNITAEPSEEIQNFTEVNNGSTISLEQDESSEIDISFNISHVDDYEGEILLSDNSSTHEESLDVSIDSPFCDYREGDYCVTGDFDAEIDDEDDQVTHDATLNYLGPLDHEETLTPESSGNISDYVSVDPEAVTINSENNTFDFNITYSDALEGSYEGNITFGDLDVPTTLESSVESTDLSFNVDDIDLGVIPEGSDQTVDADVENTGDLTVEEFSISTISFSTSLESDSLAPGETDSVEITFSSPDSSGSISLEGVNGDQSHEEDIDVDLETIPDLAQEAENLRDQRSDLEDQAESDQIQTQLSTLSAEITDIETMYNQENYQEAKDKYDSVTSSLEEIENDISASQNQNGGAGGNGGGFDDGGEFGEEDNEGLGLLPLIAVLLVIILIMFVIGTSVQPEEGDPLYNVLGK